VWKRRRWKDAEHSKSNREIVMEEDLMLKAGFQLMLMLKPEK
jgi:hypothetical protein